MSSVLEKPRSHAESDIPVVKRIVFVSGGMGGSGTAI